MGIGLQVGKTAHLEAFLKDAVKFGLRVGEHPDYGGVHPVHSAKSWHYDGKAADLNYGAPGASAAERKKLLAIIPLAQAYGLGVIFAKDGTQGSAANHKGHLHVDVGSSTNLGSAYVRVSAYDPKRVKALRLKLGIVKNETKPKPKPKPTTSQVPVLKAGSSGKATKNLQSELNRVFPAYSRLKEDGKFGGKTEDVVKDFQGRSGLKKDGVVGSKTWAALKKNGVKF